MFLISNIMELKNAKKKIKMEKDSPLFFYNKIAGKYCECNELILTRIFARFYGAYPRDVTFAMGTIKHTTQVARFLLISKVLLSQTVRLRKEGFRL